MHEPYDVVLGVGGGIAAYKVAEVLRQLTEAGHNVTVVPTDAALAFVGESTWAALSGRPVSTSVFHDVQDVPHVHIGRRADLVVVAPATADLLARAAAGLADDLLTSTLLTARGPVIFVPAMHTEMWEHPATVANVATLRDRGCLVVEPAVGRLTGADSGKGRLPEPDQIVALINEVLPRGSVDPDLGGRHVVVSAGGTREYLDPVRFIGNRSSGRQGYALAATAAARGARVTLVAANVVLDDPAGVEIIRVESAADVYEAMVKAATDADAVVMAAAVADFRPAIYTETKIKKPADDSTLAVELERNQDVLAYLSARRPHPGQVVVGFAAETGDQNGSVLDYGWAKLKSKGCDLLVVNTVGVSQGFESEQNRAVILAADGTATPVEIGPKSALAHVIWDLVHDRW